MSKLIILCLGAVFVIALSSCSTPGSVPSMGQQAVMASAMHRTTQSEVDQNLAFMRSFQQFQLQSKAQ